MTNHIAKQIIENPKLLNDKSLRDHPEFVRYQKARPGTEHFYYFSDGSHIWTRGGCSAYRCCAPDQSRPV